MCSLSKEQSILSKETIQNAFFRIMSLFRHFILYQAPYSRALAPACGAVFTYDPAQHLVNDNLFIVYLSSLPVAHLSEAPEDG